MQTVSNCEMRIADYEMTLGLATPNVKPHTERLRRSRTLSTVVGASGVLGVP
jgi:hypothetical protein